MGLPCIFLVEDDKAILESFSIILKSEGYEIFTATSGAELKLLLSKQLPDLILMDYSLGEDNGGILTRDIKRDKRTAHIPVIVISANSDFRADALLMGADDFMDKPIEIADLLSKLSQYLTRQ